MVKVIFYEKPGCINNTKQKNLLQAAGHELETHNLLTEPWTPEKLRLFFGESEVAEWFNRTAPRVKSGEVVPSAIDPETALKLMVDDPLLIRRPLIQVSDRYEVGFDIAKIDSWIGLTPPDESQNASNLINQDLQTCPRSHN